MSEIDERAVGAGEVLAGCAPPAEALGDPQAATDVGRAALEGVVIEIANHPSIGADFREALNGRELDTRRAFGLLRNGFKEVTGSGIDLEKEVPCLELIDQALLNISRGRHMQRTAADWCREGRLTDPMQAVMVWTGLAKVLRHYTGHSRVERDTGQSVLRERMELGFGQRALPTIAAALLWAHQEPGLIRPAVAYFQADNERQDLKAERQTEGAFDVLRQLVVEYRDSLTGQDGPGVQEARKRSQMLLRLFGSERSIRGVETAHQIVESYKRLRQGVDPAESMRRGLFEVLARYAYIRRISADTLLSALKLPPIESRAAVLAMSPLNERQRRQALKWMDPTPPEVLASAADASRMPEELLIELLKTHKGRVPRIRQQDVDALHALQELFTEQEWRLVTARIDPRYAQPVAYGDVSELINLPLRECRQLRDSIIKKLESYTEGGASSGV